LNALIEKYPQEINKILGKYPADQKRAAVMPLLYLAQRELGYVTKRSLNDIASILEITPTEVASIVGFYTLYHGEPEGKYHVQVCNDLPCALRGADEFLAKLCENLGIQVGETTADGLVTIEAVTCLAGCDKAPMFQVQTGEGLSYHENQTVESALALVEQWRQSQPGPVEETSPEAEETAQEAQPEQAGPAARGEPEAGELAAVAQTGAEPEAEPVLPTALHGVTRQPAEERIHIQEQGGQ
jgi:NADH-quinone oxidoreductase subunit E